jgi:ubiquinone/menaquinone biosynthesis C-methylase UbiE
VEKLMNKMDNQKIVEQQYSAPRNLENRISLHEKYSTNKVGWFNWLFSNYHIKPGNRILELGCGNGRLWSDHYDELPENATLILSDLSENMVETAKQNVSHEVDIIYTVIDIQDIPFPDGSFDIVIANMMLYHVPELGKGLSEIKRVLKSDGRFYCATLGENGIGGFIKDALHMPRVNRSKFTLQNGEAALKPYFSHVEKKLYEDSLAVTDANDLVEYIRTLPWTEGLQAVSDSELYTTLEACRKNDIISIPKEYGTFIAYNLI